MPADTTAQVTSFDYKTLAIIASVVFAVVSFILLPAYKRKFDAFVEAKIPSDKQVKMMQADASEKQQKKWQALSDEEQNKLRQGRGVKRLIEQIENRDWGAKYRVTLDGLLLWLARLFKEPTSQLAVVNDAEKPDIRLFHRELFTEKSFEFCAALAFMYPLVLIMLSWITSGLFNLAGIGTMELEQQVVPISTRLVITIGLVFMILGILVVKTHRQTVKKCLGYLVLLIGLWWLLHSIIGDVAMGLWHWADFLLTHLDSGYLK